ncbi:MAG: MATE family efflux transporter, partial [Spirochaetales bacterium]|nr:MATE family efflux transporter [Candidatus Physcosoma equi]
MQKENKTGNGITEGTIWKQILLFFFPILFGTLFQTLYNTVDAVIVGQFLGKEALAAVSGGTGTTINLVIGFFVGISSGAAVILSQHYGAKNEELVERSLHTALAISIYSGVAVSILGYLFTNPLLHWIDTPEDILPLASTYLHVYFGGALSIVVYNMGAGIYRAIGDSKHPLYFLIAGSFVNIALDILFIAVLHRGVRGAAEATIISQFFSAFLTLYFLYRRTDSCALKPRKMLFIDKRIASFMIKLGVPGGIQSVMYSLSNMLIQTNVNRFGTDTAAAWASYGKLDVIFWMIVNAFGISITTFVGQNYGAGRIDRARRGLKECFGMTML